MSVKSARLNAAHESIVDGVRQEGEDKCKSHRREEQQWREEREVCTKEEGERENEGDARKPEEECGVADVDLSHILFVLPADFCVCAKPKTAQYSEERSFEGESLMFHDPNIGENTHDEHEERRRAVSFLTYLSGE